MRGARRFIAALMVMAPTAATAQSSALSIWSRGAWRVFWRSDSAPAAWNASSPIVARALQLHRAADGVSWGELRLSGSGEAWRVRAVVVRIDPRRVRLRVVEAASAVTGARWTVDSAMPDDIVAFNAGQFVGASPWGWVVREGREAYSPESGPLSLAFAIDTAGRTHWFEPGALAKRDRRAIAEAIQSYPTLLHDGGVVPDELRRGDRGVDLEHRDARLAIGETRDGMLIVMLTRFDAAGESLGALPFGLTTPEESALMGALGCRIAVALDGGISAQLMVRDATQPVPATYAWHGLRKVPVAIVAEPRR